MRLAQLQAAQDAERGETLAALVDLVQVGGGVERRRGQPPVGRCHGREVVAGCEGVERHRPYGVIDVLGAGDRRQPSSRARAHERSIGPRGASQDHSLCTWPSAGIVVRAAAPRAPVTRSSPNR